MTFKKGHVQHHAADIQNLQPPLQTFLRCFLFEPQRQIHFVCVFFCKSCDRGSPALADRIDIRVAARSRSIRFINGERPYGVQVPFIDLLRFLSFQYILLRKMCVLVFWWRARTKAEAVFGTTCRRLTTWRTRNEFLVCSQVSCLPLPLLVRGLSCC